METSVNKKCKSFTSLEQSRKLAEILPIESADMYYSKHDSLHANTLYGSCDIQDFNIREYIPCWSLAALLWLMPRIEHLKPFIDLSPKLDSEGVSIYYHSEDSPYIVKDNLIDAAFEMILKLHELKML